MSNQLLSLHRVPVLDALPSEIQTTLEHSADQKLFRRRQIVFREEEKNDCVYVLASGRVKLVRCAPHGRELTLAIVNPSDLFGECDLFDSNACYGCTAEVMEDAAALVFRRSDLASALAASPDALRAIAVMQSRRRVLAESRLAECVFYDVPVRLGHLLAHLATDHGRTTKEGMLIRLKLTHQELANLVGSTRETTTLILNDFRRRGWLEFSGRKIVVAEPDELRRMGGASHGERRIRARAAGRR